MTTQDRAFCMHGGSRSIDPLAREHMRNNGTQRGALPPVFTMCLHGGSSVTGRRISSSLWCCFAHCVIIRDRFQGRPNRPEHSLPLPPPQKKKSRWKKTENVLDTKSGCPAPWISSWMCPVLSLSSSVHCGFTRTLNRIRAIPLSTSLVTNTHTNTHAQWCDVLGADDPLMVESGENETQFLCADPLHYDALRSARNSH